MWMCEFWNPTNHLVPNFESTRLIFIVLYISCLLGWEGKAEDPHFRPSGEGHELHVSNYRLVRRLAADQMLFSHNPYRQILLL